MHRDTWSSTALVVGALTGIFALVLHPTGHDMLAGADRVRQTSLSVWVHSVAIAGVPLTFIGLLGLWRRLEKSDLATAALVLFGFAGVGVLSAAVASGFISTPLTQWILASEGTARDGYHALLMLSGLMNQGFAKVHTVAAAAAILLWSVALLRTPMPWRSAGMIGVIIGSGVLLGFFSGTLRMDVHGFGIITFAQSFWMIWVAVLLWRGDRHAAMAGSPVSVSGTRATPAGTA